MSDRLVHIPELAVRLAYNGYDFSKKDLGSIVDDIMRSNRKNGKLVRSYVFPTPWKDVFYKEKEIQIPYL